MFYKTQLCPVSYGGAGGFFVCLFQSSANSRTIPDKRNTGNKNETKNNSKTKGIQSENNLVVGFIRLV